MWSDIIQKYSDIIQTNKLKDMAECSDSTLSLWRRGLRQPGNLRMRIFSDSLEEIGKEMVKDASKIKAKLNLSQRQE